MEADAMGVALIELGTMRGTEGVALTASGDMFCVGEWPGKASLSIGSSDVWGKSGPSSVESSGRSESVRSALEKTLSAKRQERRVPLLTPIS